MTLSRDDVERLIGDLRLHAFDDCGEQEPPETHIAIIAADTIQSLSERIGRLEERCEGAFNHGYLVAVANIVHLHDEPTLAQDVLGELGVTEGIIKKLDMSDYDAKPLRKMFRELNRLERNRQERENHRAALSQTSGEGR